MINRVELLGRVQHVRIQQVGDSRVAKLSLATDYMYKDNNGKPVIETSFHNLVIWEGERQCNLDKIAKGSTLHAEGRIRTSVFTATPGDKRTVQEVIVSRSDLIVGYEAGYERN